MMEDHDIVICGHCLYSYKRLPKLIDKGIINNVNYYQNQINIYRYIFLWIYLYLIKINMYIIWIVSYNNIIILNFNFFYSFWFNCLFSLFFSFFTILHLYNYDKVVLLIGVFIGELIKLLLLRVGDVVWTTIFWLLLNSITYWFNILLLI